MWRKGNKVLNVLATFQYERHLENALTAPAVRRLEFISEIVFTGLIE